MNVNDIKRVLIIGSGNMGQQIGFLFAINGFHVVLYDTASEMLPAAIKRIEKLCKGFIKGGHLKPEEAVAALKIVSATNVAEKAAENIDFVSESVPEDPELKGNVLGLFNALCPERTIFTTNTSTLVPSMFAKATGRPEKFAAFHFHDVRTSKIVDIMPHSETAPETVSLIRDLAEKMELIPIVVSRENEGYVFNAMLSNLFNTALTLAEQKVASIEDIDRSWMGVMHTFLGPFGIMDQVGLNTVWTVSDYQAGKRNDPQLKANADFLKRYIDEGLLGAKTRKGFYSYPDPEYLKPGFVSGKP